MGDDLVAFLRARLEEDEQMARAASPAPWSANAEHDEVLAVDGETVADGFALSSNQLRATVDHIVRHDPARVLREVEAKRLILRDLEQAEFTLSTAGRGTPPHDLMTGAVNMLRRTLRLLALPYADHPGYRAEWRP